MYRMIVKKKVTDTFRELSTGNYQALLDQLADGFSYEFVGDHSLGGRRTTKAAMTEWFERLGRLFGGPSFETVSVEVGGPPWNTTVLTEVIVKGTLGGEAYENILFQRINLDKGKIVAIKTLEDTQLLSNALAQAARSGVEEAEAAPIVG